ncbi:hypothetical protein Lal_00000441 [Lupinus albus]|nr:hypothetical protein Lal_00000441 [Lupinus albus]
MILKLSDRFRYWDKEKQKEQFELELLGLPEKEAFPKNKRMPFKMASTRKYTAQCGTLVENSASEY